MFICMKKELLIRASLMPNLTSSTSKRWTCTGSSELAWIFTGPNRTHPTPATFLSQRLTLSACILHVADLCDRCDSVDRRISKVSETPLFMRSLHFIWRRVEFQFLLRMWVTKLNVSVPCLKYERNIILRTFVAPQIEVWILNYVITNKEAHIVHGEMKWGYRATKRTSKNAALLPLFPPCS